MRAKRKMASSKASRSAELLVAIVLRRESPSVRATPCAAEPFYARSSRTQAQLCA